MVIILDTSVIINFLRTGSFSPELPHGVAVGVSPITIQELFQGLSTKNDLVGQHINEFISSCLVFDYTQDVAKLAGTLVRDGHCNCFADAAIAASAIVHHASLVTKNVKDFRNVPGLTIV